MFSKLKENQRKILELLMAGISLSLGLEFIASSLQNILSLPDIYLLATVLIIVLVSLAYFVFQILGNSEHNELIKGFFVYRKDNNSIIQIDRYHYSEQLHMYLTSAFSENEAFKTKWDDEKLTEIFKFDNEKRTAIHNNPESRRFLIEATEYYLLDKLSTHLTDYFNSDSFDSVELVEFQREDVPDVLLHNRLMELFSRSMDQRPAFLSHNKVDHSRTVAMFGDNTYFSRFDLTLPKGTKVRRIGPGHIEIETNRLKFSLAILFEGTGTVLPRKFMQYYVGIEDPLKYSAFNIKVRANARFRKFALLTLSGWEMYAWSESFLAKLHENFSERDFFTRIGWESSVTILDCAKKMNLNLDDRINGNNSTDANDELEQGRLTELAADAKRG